MAEESLLPSQQLSPNFAFKTKDFKRVFVIMSLFAFIQMGFVTILPVAFVSPARLSGMELSKEDWAALPDKARVTVSVAPENILLLRE